MEKPALAVIAVIVGLAVGGGVAVLLIPRGGITPLQVPGDPPITIGDGSMRGHSANDWRTDADGGVTIVAKNPGGDGAGSFHQGGQCAIPNGNQNASAFLWTDFDDLPHDISPTNLNNVNGWSVTLADANNAQLKVTIANGHVQLVASGSGSPKFDNAKADDEHERRLSPAGKVRTITVADTSSGSTATYTMSQHHPHFTLGFCFN